MRSRRLLWRPPDRALIRPTGLDPAARFRIRGRREVNSGGELAQGIIVPFGLADDTDVIVLDRAR